MADGGARHPVLGAAQCARGLASVPADLGKGVDILAVRERDTSSALPKLTHDSIQFNNHHHHAQPPHTQPQDGEEQQRTFLLGYDGRGFEVRDINYRGSILAFPNACFLWRARTVADITPEALAPILMVKPPIGACVRGRGWGVVVGSGGVEVGGFSHRSCFDVTGAPYYTRSRDRDCGRGGEAGPARAAGDGGLAGQAGRGGGADGHGALRVKKRVSAD